MDAALQAGAPDVPVSESVATLKAVIESVLLFVDFNTLSKGRVPRSAIGNLNGLSALVARQTARPMPATSSLSDETMS
jgi:hypothetical protein